MRRREIGVACIPAQGSQNGEVVFLDFSADFFRASLLWQFPAGAISYEKHHLRKS